MISEVLLIDGLHIFYRSDIKSIRLFKTECKVVVVGVTASEKRITIKSNSREE